MKSNIDNFYENILSGRINYNSASPTNRLNIFANNSKISDDLFQIHDINKNTPLWSMREDENIMNIKKKVIKKSNTPINNFNVYKNLIKEGVNPKSKNEITKKKKNLSAIGTSAAIANIIGIHSPISKKINSPLKLIENNILRSSKAQVRKESKINYDYNIIPSKGAATNIFRNKNLLNKSNLKVNNTANKSSTTKLRTNSKTNLQNKEKVEVTNNDLFVNNNTNNDPAKVKNSIKNIQTNRIPSSAKALNIIRKVKEIASNSNVNNPGIKKKILDEQYLYEQNDTLPGKGDKNININMNIMNQKVYISNNNFNNESETIKIEEGPSYSKINNTIDTKTDIYQILNNMNSSSEYKPKGKDSHFFTSRQLESLENKNISFKIANEEEKGNMKHILIQSITNRIEPVQIKQEDEFIKNKYKSLLSEYFTC